MGPKLRKRFVDSMDYLRKMGFFKDYSNLSSEEILEKIIKISRTRGYAEKKDAEIDYEVARFDTKRVLKFSEIEMEKECVALLRRLTEVSRNAFQPTDIKREWEMHWLEGGAIGGTISTISFKFKGIEHKIESRYKKEGDEEILTPDSLWRTLRYINYLIGHTGYQYYEWSVPEGRAYVVLTQEEAKKLEKERGWSLHCISGLNPELKKRFVDSIEYLRKMDFFKDYSDLTSEEILEKIFRGEMVCWQEELRKEPCSSHGRRLDESLVKNEDLWMKSSDAEINYEVAHFDTKRVFKASRIRMGGEAGTTLLKGLARISRDVFQPTDIKQVWKLPWSVEGMAGETLLVVSFKFKGIEHEVDFKYLEVGDEGVLLPDSLWRALRYINYLIGHTGYQYYEWSVPEGRAYVVLTQEEAKKLEKERGWSLHYIPGLNPELKKRFVDSIEYLRKMDFFKDYSDLTSEEILEKIFRGEMDYRYCWEEELEKEPRFSHGRRLNESLVENEELWMKRSNAQIDREIIPFDNKRTFVERTEAAVDEKMGAIILERLAKISRDVFQPTNVSSRWLTPTKSKWLIQEVSFDFKGRRHSIEIALRHDWIEDMGLKELNEIVGDTGYQYYQVRDEYIVVVMLTKEEAEKLAKERGWKFEYLY